MLNYRFPNKAYWHKRVITDNVEIRAEVKAVPFRCVRVQKRKAWNANSGGAVNDNINLSLRTDSKLAENIKPLDMIEFDGYKHSVNAIEAVKSIIALNAYEYILHLE